MEYRLGVEREVFAADVQGSCVSALAGATLGMVAGPVGAVCGGGVAWLAGLYATGWDSGVVFERVDFFDQKPGILEVQKLLSQSTDDSSDDLVARDHFAYLC